MRVICATLLLVTSLSLNVSAQNLDVTFYNSIDLYKEFYSKSSFGNEKKPGPIKARVFSLGHLVLMQHPKALLLFAQQIRCYNIYVSPAYNLFCHDLQLDCSLLVRY